MRFSSRCREIFPVTLDSSGVKRILLTASGGPFRTVPLCDLDNVTPQQACAHPNWVMGRKISVDSATMMNKGLEVIEAHWLFNADADKIQVVIHPQSVIHSMVEYVDGSVLAQLGNPDMRTPIAYALGFPERIDAGVSSLDLFKIAHLDFEAPDTVRFPCLGLAYQALRQGGTAPATLNAANEVAVDAFLDERIPFKLIPAMIESVLEKNSCQTGRGTGRCARCRYRGARIGAGVDAHDGLRMSLLFTLAAFAVTLGILIVVHEYGHYIVARWCGVRVLRFSVGFGKPLHNQKICAGRNGMGVGRFPAGRLRQDAGRAGRAG